MKKVLFLVILWGLLISACLPASLQPDASSPAPGSEADLQATAAVLSQQTLQALPTLTLPPSHTPVVTTATAASTAQVSFTATQNAIPLGLTATPTTLLTNTGNGSITPPATYTLAFFTPDPLMSATLTGTAHPQHYGTMPPSLPSGQITLINKSKAEVYISLQCTTKDGYVSIIETPVSGTTKLKAPAGKYVYVAWVGGRKFVGNFSLGKDGELKIKIFKDRLEIGS